MVNGHKVNIPSFLVKAGDEIEVKEKSKKIDMHQGFSGEPEQRGVTEWLEMDKDAKKGKVKALPERKDMPMAVQETLIIEYYSK